MDYRLGVERYGGSKTCTCVKAARLHEQVLNLAPEDVGDGRIPRVERPAGERDLRV